MSEYITATECREGKELLLDGWINYWKSINTGILTPMILKLEKELELCQKKKTQ